MVRELPLGWRTDLDVLKLGGSRLEHRGGHLVITSPDNPGFHWGNFILVVSSELAADPQRCQQVFRESIPAAGHVAIGLPARGDAAWRDTDVEYEWDEVLCADAAPPSRVCPVGYEVRQLDGDQDWAQCLAADLVEHERTGGTADESYIDFVRGRMRTRDRLTRSGAGAFFGAFGQGRLVADLGIVLCGDGLARFQSVATDQAHRRRGLAACLLGVAGAWAGERAVRRWVIVAEPDSDANRLYRSLGMVACAESHQVYRPGR